MRKLTLTFVLVVGMAATGFAQREFFALAWEINVPTNSNYLNKTSFAGGKAEYRKFLSENMSFGLAWTWASSEKWVRSARPLGSDSWPAYRRAYSTILSSNSFPNRFGA